MNRKGVTLIELMVALVIVSILIAGIYRTFASQQHTYTVQEQVSDMQQNVRLALHRMTRELRMAGYGRMDATFFGADGVHGIYRHVVNPGGSGTVTVVGGYRLAATLSANALTGTKTIQLNVASEIDLARKQYISINGFESHRIKKITGNQIELFANLTNDHQAGEPVFLIMAITYSLGNVDGKPVLLRDENLGQGPQAVAENIEFLRFRYVMNTGETLEVVPNARLDDIRMIEVTLVARTDQTDPELAKVGDGFRRRTLVSDIQIRNLAM